MASSARIFFAGVGTTFFILAIGFGAGLMLAKTAVEPAAPSRSLVDRLPPARIILPASAEAATPSQQPEDARAVADEGRATQQRVLHQAVAASEAPAPTAPVKEVQQAPEKDKQAARAERHKAEAEERTRRRKYAERKARREAARLAAQQQQEQQPSRQQPGILAFGRDDDQSRGAGTFFGN
jgi:type IV secretory pathway VirB10-like protein